MPLQDLTTPPTAPQRSDHPETFADRADAMVAWFATFVSEMQTLTAQLEATAALLAAAPAYADPTLKTIADSSLTAASNKAILFTGAATAALIDISSFGQSLIDDTDAATARTTLGLGALATAGTINGSNWSGDDLAVTDGGTGASSASAARTNLSAAASGANSDITSLSGLTTALSVAQGGTGAITAALALVALGGAGWTVTSLTTNAFHFSLALPNGDTLVIKGGTGSLGGNSTGTLSFGVTFGSAPVAIANGGTSDTAQEGDVSTTAAPTTTGVAIKNSASSTITYNWIAIGKG